MSCGYWNFSMNNGRYVFSDNAFLQFTALLLTMYRGGWDTEGVTVVSNDVNNSTITCLSTHLASFVVLEHLSADQNEVCKTTLQIRQCHIGMTVLVLQDVTEQDHSSVHVVSYIGCSISLACLLVTAFTLVYYR